MGFFNYLFSKLLLLFFVQLVFCCLQCFAAFEEYLTSFSNVNLSTKYYRGLSEAQPLSNSVQTNRDKAAQGVLLIPYFIEPVFKSFFYTFLSVGDPVQLQSVILDSGSSLLGFPSSMCTDCGQHMNPMFDLNQTKSARWLACLSPQCHTRLCSYVRHNHSCGYNQRYVEGSSISGFFISDFVALGWGDFRSKFVRYDYIGCHLSETHLFRNQSVNGIMGLAGFRSHPQRWLIKNILASTPKRRQIFAMCTSDTGGVLQLGGYNSNWHIQTKCPVPFEHCPFSKNVWGEAVKIGWTSIILNRGYHVYAESIRLVTADESLLVELYRTCSVDSGSTSTYMPQEFLNSYRAMVMKQCKKNPNKRCAILDTVSHQEICWSSLSELNPETDLPNLYITFADRVPVEWRPNAYLSEEWDGDICVQINVRSDDACVLGMSFFKHKNIIFDLENNRMGFVNAQCPPVNPAVASNLSKTLSFDEIFHYPNGESANNSVTGLRMNLRDAFSEMQEIGLWFLALCALAGLTLFCLRHRSSLEYSPVPSSNGTTV